MNHLMLLLYIYGSLDKITATFVFLCIISGLVYGAQWILYAASDFNDYYENDKEDKDTKDKGGRLPFIKLRRLCLKIFIPSLLIVTFLPTSQTFASMVLVPYLAKNEQLQKLPDNILKTANDAMEALQKKLTTTGGGGIR